MYRVLVLTSTFPRWRDDTEPRFVLDLCRHLRSYAHVRVLAPHAPGALREEVLDGVAVSRFRYFVPSWQALAYEGGIVSRIRERPWRIVQLVGLFFSLYAATRREIAKWKPDVIHAHWILPQGLAACLAARGRIPVVCTSHGGDLFGLQGRLFERIKAWTLSRCSAITVVSDSMRDIARQLAPRVPVSTIPMGTDVSTVFTPPVEPGLRSREEIVFAGRLVEKKGLSYLIDAIGRLKQRKIAARLTIAGDGPLREALQRRVRVLGLADEITFVGGVPHSALARIYRRAAIAVFPFVVAVGGDQEGFGLVVTEAMACGCPVIASDLPAIRQSITPDVTAVLCPPGDAEKLAAAIDNLLADRQARSSLAAAALKTVRERFDWLSIAREYADVYEQSVSGRKV